jgi:hypothetical protein
LSRDFFLERPIYFDGPKNMENKDKTETPKTEEPPEPPSRWKEMILFLAIGLASGKKVPQLMRRTL